MSQSLQIRPEDVIRTGNELTERFVRATEQARKVFTELSNTAGTPASGDQVSREAAKALRDSGTEFQRPTAGAFQALAEAAQAIIGIAQSFDTADKSGGGDTSGGGDKSGGGASSLQAVVEGLAPLTQLATTLPQMIAEATSATGENGDAAALAADQDVQGDQDDGAEVPPQGATVV